MKKLVTLCSFVLLISLAVFAQSKKAISSDSLRIKNIEEKISQGLDSIIRNDIYTVDGRGYKYYRFSRGVFVPHASKIVVGEFVAQLDSTDIGGIGSLNRISFRYHNGEILFRYFDYFGEQYAEKTMEQLLFAIREYW